ncbi:MAG TPA: MtrB/PioB family decaheme-associated outer membrane protein [Nitrospirota bacterium]|nr:MtrB/PioB family decaheme-associated outer membrane protein [Nitrospirota bacterium]
MIKELISVSLFYIVTSAFLLTFCILPVISMAGGGPEGTISIGVGDVTLNNQSFKYGEYNGLSKNSAFLVGSADLSYGYDEFYIDFRGDQLGLNNSNFYLESGKYGRYRMFLNYDQFPRLISNTARTPFEGAGGRNLTLPAGFVKGATTPAMTTLESSNREVDLETEQLSKGLGFSMNLGHFMDFQISFKRSEKDGTKFLGGTLGISGGNTRSIVLPMPLNYISDDLSAALAYSDEKGHLQFEYYLSNFTNNRDAITWENPFQVTGYPEMARTSLPPDNSHQRFNLSGGMSLPLSIQISTTLEYGIMEQNDVLLPYSINPASIVTAPVPRRTAEAEIATTHIGVTLSAHPLSRLGINARYRYYETNNKTPRQLFLYVKNDYGGPQAAPDSEDALYNLPYDSILNQLKLDASYNLLNTTTLVIGYDNELTNRTFREIKKTKENTYRAGLRSNPSTFVKGGINYTFSSRKAEDPYSESNLYDYHHTESYIDSVSPDVRFENHPGLRKFDIADRDRTSYDTNITLFPHYTVTTGLYYNHWEDEFGNSELGLLYSKNNSYTVDTAWMPADIFSVSIYYTREDQKWKQAGRHFRDSPGTYDKFTESNDTDRNWWVIHDDDVDTIGIESSLGLMENRLIVSAGYSYSESATSIRFRQGVSLTSSELPDLSTKIQTVDFQGKYGVNDRMSLGLGLLYENFKSYDWAIDGVEPASASLANVITLSGDVPDYKVYRVMFVVTYTLGK